MTGGYNPWLDDGREVDKNLTNQVLPKGKRSLLFGDTKTRGLKDRLGDAGRIMAYDAKKKLISSAKKTVGKNLKRTALGAAGAVPLAVLAAGAGAALGDPGKAAALVGGAAAAGASFTNYQADKLKAATDPIIESGKAGFWGTDAGNIDRAKADQAVYESPETMNTFIREFGSSEAGKAALSDPVVQAMRNNGETDAKKLAKGVKLRNKYKERYLDKKNNPNMTEARALELANERTVATDIMYRKANPGVFKEGSADETSWKEYQKKKALARGADDETATSTVDEILSDIKDHFVD